jgi:proteic killer suppression protein
VDIVFQTIKLQKVFNAEKLLRKEYGEQIAKSIIRRMGVLAAAPSLQDVSHRPPERRHELSGERSAQFAVDLVHPYRLIFRPTANPIPRKPDGGIDLLQVTAIEIMSVEDYH